MSDIGTGTRASTGVSTGSAQNRYSTGAMVFHWVIAIAVIANWRIAAVAEHASETDAAYWMGHHKALGISILALSILRLLWRLAHPVPAMPNSYATWEKMLARTVHFIFYVLLIGLPIGGWLGVSLFGGNVDMWGLFTLPGLPVGEARETGKAIIGLHKTGGEIFIYLIALHIIGALKHTFWNKDGTLFRMLPFGNPNR